MGDDDNSEMNDSTICIKCGHPEHEGRCTFDKRANGETTGTADGICPCDSRVATIRTAVSDA